MAKVRNMTSFVSGKEVANQFIITEKGCGALGNFITRETFQSYDSVIVIKTQWKDEMEIELDEYYWNYSTTTGKYRNAFLGEDRKETEKKIKSGEYTLSKLN